MNIRAASPAPRQMQDDHAAALARLDVLSAAVRAYAGSGAPADAVTVRFELGWFDGPFTAHMDREDAGALPVMEQAIGQWCSLPAWARREHADLKRKIREVHAALDRVRPGETGAAAALESQTAQFDAMVRSHLHREDAWLLPVAAAVLTPGQWAAIGEGWT